MRSLASFVLTAAALPLTVAAQQLPRCVPFVQWDGPTCACDTATFLIHSDPGCLVGMLVGTQLGPLPVLGAIIPFANGGWLLGGGQIPPDGSPICIGCKYPDIPGLTIYYWPFGIDPTEPTLRIIPGRLGQFRICEPDGRPRTLSACVVIIDEDTIDNGHSRVQAAAASHSVSPDWLVNDDRPTEVGNPWLRWNTEHAGDIVLLPGGRRTDEGWFALPASPPWSVASFVAGTVPQSQLDEIVGVMPLRNHDLAAMVGQTCVAVVYDSDISINYNPITGNLQGARYGLFAFTVLDVVLPGTIPESQSDTSLYDVLVRVEGPLTGSNPVQVTRRDDVPDDLSIERAVWTNDRVEVVVDSDVGSSASVTVSIEGLVFEADLFWLNGKFRRNIPSQVDMRGRRITVSSAEGGVYNALIQ